MTENDMIARLAELEFELKKYKEAYRQAGLDYFDVNLDTGKAFQSEYLAEKMGYEEDDLNTFEKRNATFHPSDLQDSLKSVEQMMRNEISCTDLLFRIYGKNGDLFWIKHDGSLVMDSKDQSRHFVGILRDITQEKSYLESLQHLVQ